MKNNTCDVCGISYSPIFGGCYDRENKQQLCPSCAKKREIKQIMLPDPADDDEHPRLLLSDGEAIHAGDTFMAMLTDGNWYEITLEVDWDKTGPYCWYISNELLRSSFSPVGLFVRLKPE